MVEFAIRSPSLPYNCFKEVAPSLLLKNTLLASNQTQGALKSLRIITCLGKGHAAIWLFICDEIIENIPNTYILDNSHKTILLIGVQVPF
jgi:hypothetical protein